MKPSIAFAACFTCIAILLSAFSLSAQKGKSTIIDLKKAIQEKKVHVFNRTVIATDKGIQLNALDGDGVAWINGINFSQGEIEVDIKGKDLQGRSFVGVAFHGVNDSTYDVVYLRPFNFKATDPARKSHSIQYVSSPDFGWEKLRNEFPGKYENSIEPAPDPDEWVHIKIIVQDNTVTTLVGSNGKPALTVTKLTSQSNGKIGLWVGNGSSGDFANLKILTY
jgi:hypothetical protein